MRQGYLKKAALSALAGLLALTVPGIAAESLAGKVGDKRFSPYLSLNPKEGCNRDYNAYVAASGHSAYVTTFYSRVVDLHIICGARLNEPTQKAAEDRAMQACQAALKKHKFRTSSGGCAIAASK
jgi:hypothetical protein